jgi:ribosomal protein L4
MQVDVLDIKGQKTGRTVELPEDVFGIEPNDHVIYLAVKQYFAAGPPGYAQGEDPCRSTGCKPQTAQTKRNRWCP